MSLSPVSPSRGSKYDALVETLVEQRSAIEISAAVNTLIRQLGRASDKECADLRERLLTVLPTALSLAIEKRDRGSCRNLLGLSLRVDALLIFRLTTEQQCSILAPDAYGEICPLHKILTPRIPPEERIAFLEGLAKADPAVQAAALASRGYDGQTILAAVATDYEVLEALIPVLKAQPPEAQYAQLCKGDRENTALHLAAESGKTVCVELLVEYILEVIDPEEFEFPFLDENARQETPLMLALETGDADMIQCVMGLYTHFQAPIIRADRVIAFAMDNPRREVLEPTLKLLGPSAVIATMPLVGLPEKLTPMADEEADEPQSPLHTAANSGNIAAFDLMLSYLETKVRWQALGPDGDGRTVLLHAVKSGNPEMVAAVLAQLGDHAKDFILYSSLSGLTPVCAAAKLKNPVILRLLLEYISAEELASITAELQGQQGPLIAAAKYGRSTNLGLLLEKIKDSAPETRALALNPYYSETSLFIELIKKKRAKLLEAFCALLDGIHKDARFELLLGPRSYDDSTALIQATKLTDPKILEILLKAMTSEEIRAAVQPNKSGFTPLHGAFQGQALPMINRVIEVMDHYAPESVRIAMGSACSQGTILQLASARNSFSFFGFGAASSSSEDVNPALGRALKLLGRLTTDLELALALGSAPRRLVLEPQVRKCMRERYADPEAAFRILVLNRLFYGQAFDVEPIVLRGFDRDKSIISDHSFPFPPAVDEVLRKKKHLLQEAVASIPESDPRFEDLAHQYNLITTWHSTMLKPLIAASGLDEESLSRLIPLLLEMQELAQPALRTQLTRVLMRFAYGCPEFWKQLFALQSSVAAANAPHLYLICLAAFRELGVPESTVAAVHQVVQTHKKGLMEGSGSGKLLIRALSQLALRPRLEVTDIKTVLQLLGESQDLDELRGQLTALDQVLSLGAEERLTQANFHKYSFDLASVAKVAFEELMPIGDVEGFSEKFHSAFTEGRSPEAVVTYASRQRHNPRVIRAFGAWVSSVLQGRDQLERYQAHGNPHLQRLYEAAPELREILPGLCKTMGVRSVAELAPAAGGMRFPLDRQSLYTKALHDRHLSAEPFPFLVDYLTKPDSDAQAALAAIKDARKVKGRGRSQADVQRHSAILRLQEMLILLASSPSRMDKLKALRKAFQTANDLEKRGVPVGDEFINDLKIALRAAEKQAKSRELDMGSYQVLLTDHYLDLLLIGSDMGGSCQRVNGEPQNNRALMGYILDGKDFPIVVKAPGDSRSLARRMLRFELDQDGHPALFIERLYTDLHLEQVDDAIIAMAKEVAARLGLRLYAKDIEGEPREYDYMESFGSKAPFTYSDASDYGVCAGHYTVGELDLLYRPAASASSSSSANP